MKMMRGTKNDENYMVVFITRAARTFDPQAQTTIDVAKITCEEFVTATTASPDNIAIWLSGYYHGKRGTTTIDVEQLKEQPLKILSYCLYTDKGGTVMEAIEKLHLQGEFGTRHN
jgi:acid stress chaperone HdeB